MPIVELIYDLDCPNVEQTRGNLMRAFSQARVQASWSEWDWKSPDCPQYAKQFGSPTVLVDGKDVAGEPGSDGNCCRIYEGAEGNKGAPPVEMIARALAPANSPKGWKSSLAAVPGIGAVLLPKLTCPACWPAYASISSSLGIGFFNYTEYLFPITLVAVVIALFALGFKASIRQGYGPLALGSVAAVALVIGKFQMESELMVYGAVAIFLIASIWNAIPRRNRVRC